MKKLTGICFVILFLLALLPAGSAHAADYYVGPNGLDGNSGTSANTPFATIQHAIDVANAGDTVFVATGTYNENIAMKKGVSVIGKSPADTIIQAPIAIVQGVVNFHDVDCAIFKNFTITIPPIQKQVGVDRGVVFDGSSDATAVLENCIIYGVQYGIYVWAPATSSIVNNVLDGKGTGEQGIYIGNDATSPQIINNIVTGWNWGIHVIDDVAPYSNDPNIEYNDVWGNTENYIFSDSTTDTPFTPQPTTYNNRGDISEDPLFVDAASNDYHLSTGSKCIGSGFPNGEFQNPAILNPGDGGFDMGAYGGGGNTFMMVNKGGSGSGTVTSSGGTSLAFYPLTATPNYPLACASSCPGWIIYPDTCSSCNSYYTAGSEITLTATADPGSYFGGWRYCTAPASGALTTQRYFLYRTQIAAMFIPCSYSVTPASATFPYTGGNGVIDVTAPVGCVWNISTGSLPASMTITSAMSGTGNGTITYTISQNTSGLSYSTGFTLFWEGNVNFNIIQDGDPSCTYSISPTSQSFSNAGGTSSINVTTPTGCTWNAAVGSPGLFQPPYPWITINSGSSGSGSGTVNYTVAPSSDPGARTGWIGVAAQEFNISQAACTFAINPYKTVLPASGGTGYKVSVTASNSSCAWTAASNDAWLTLDSGSSGTGNGTVTYSAAANTGTERTGTITIAGLTFKVSQIDNSLQETIVPPSGPTRPGEPLWITATFVNNTGQSLITGKPTCCDTYFWVTDAQGNMVPPRDRVCEPVGIPDSIVFLPPGSFTITCDLSEMYGSGNLTAGTYNMMATFVNPLPWDPDYDPATGGCRSTATDRIECYDLKPVVAPSAITTITIGGASVQKKLAVLEFNPLGWDPQWASVDGPAISAQISNIDGHVLSGVNDINLSSVLLNGKVPIIAGSAVVQNGVLTVKFDRSQTVQSLGSLFPGTTAVVTIQGSFSADTDIFYGQASVDIVKDPGTLLVQFDLHTVGKGSQPSVAKAPISGMEARVFDKQQGSCAAGIGISWQNYPAIWAHCTPVAAVTTDVRGQAMFVLPQGDYLVIGSYNAVYAGVSVGPVGTGSIVNKYLQVIQTADGNIFPAKYQKFTGSELLLIEPEYMEWSGTQELYPFVFESSGDWSVTTSVTPPEGFVSDQEILSTDVNSTLTALQFTVTDIGSKWVSTKVKHEIKHKGKTLNVESKIGLKLAPGLQRKLGLGEFGEKE